MIDIKWDSRFEIGHPRIDHEHRVFIDLIRSISLAAEQHCSPEKAVRMLQEVRKYAEFHFISEENIMLDVGFPGYEEHRAEHAALLNRLEYESHRFYYEEVGLDAIAEFMFEWFAMHTSAADKKIAEWIPHSTAAPESA